MFVRFASLGLAAVLLATSVSHADDASPERPPVHVTSTNPLTGIILTTTGGSLLLGSPVVVLVGAGIATALSPGDLAAAGPIVLGAFASACIGLGMLIPGIVMLATHKRAPKTDRAPKEPTWADRGATRAPRAFSIPLFRASF